MSRVGKEALSASTWSMVFAYGSFRGRRSCTAMDLFRQVDADVFHSQDPSLGTWLAMKAMPGRAHVVTFRDPMEAADWRIEFNHAGPARLATLAYLLYCR